MLADKPGRILQPQKNLSTHLVPEGAGHEGEVVSGVVAVPDGRHEEGGSRGNRPGHALVHAAPKPVGGGLVPARHRRAEVERKLHGRVIQVEHRVPPLIALGVETVEAEAVRLRERDHEAAVDEELRRHIISSVVKAMSELGFVVGKPKLLRESGNVAVVGTLSSGRTIRFDVRATGEMEFDMDGFKDRTCSDSLDEVLLLMEKQFGVESGPVQHNWKNPDRISKGSKGFPTGGNTRTMGGGGG